MQQDADKPVEPQDEFAAAAQPDTPDQTDDAVEDAASVEVSEVESLRRDLEAMKDKYLRALADCQNIQKRAAAERREAEHRGQADLAKALLPVLDNFERTVEVAKDIEAARSVVEGVKIVRDQLVKILSEFGLERMPLAKGDPFDPEYHQAVAHHPTDEVEPDRVLHVAQTGYTMRGRLLRAASVVVAASPQPASQETGENG